MVLVGETRQAVVRLWFKVAACDAAAGQGFENPHVDVVTNTAVEGQPRLAIDPGHLERDGGVPLPGAGVLHDQRRPADGLVDVGDLIDMADRAADVPEEREDAPDFR